MKKFFIRTFGCQMNVHDSERMAGVLAAQGYEEAASQKDADLIVFNTCSIREKAEQKFFSELGRARDLKRSRPGLKVAVAGCIAQQMGEGVFRRAPHVDHVLGPQNIHRLVEMIGEGGAAGADGRRLALEDNPAIAQADLPAIRKEKGRAWVNIMYGCDNFCSYCIVPYTRGRERSRPSEAILDEIRGLVAEGCREVTLLGQNVNSYRGDTDFPGLLEKINRVAGLERIRFVTSHPRDLTDGLIMAMAGLDKVCENIHLPMQSGSTRVLGLMNRGYTREEYIEKVERLRAAVPGIAITTDIIAGFPAESEEDHGDTVEALKTLRFDGIFAFKYSKRPGTAASTMEGHLDEATKLGRLKEMLALQDEVTLAINKALEGTVQEVLVEGPSETDPARLTGRTRTNKVVNFEGEGGMVGRLVSLHIKGARMHSLEGVLAENR